MVGPLRKFAGKQRFSARQRARSAQPGLGGGASGALVRRLPFYQNQLTRPAPAGGIDKTHANDAALLREQSADNRATTNRRERRAASQDRSVVTPSIRTRVTAVAVAGNRPSAAPSNAPRPTPAGSSCISGRVSVGCLEQRGTTLTPRGVAMKNARYSASKSRTQGRSAWTLTFRHPPLPRRRGSSGCQGSAGTGHQ